MKKEEKLKMNLAALTNIAYEMATGEFRIFSATNLNVSKNFMPHIGTSLGPTFTGTVIATTLANGNKVCDIFNDDTQLPSGGWPSGDRRNCRYANNSVPY